MSLIAGTTEATDEHSESKASTEILGFIANTGNRGVIATPTALQLSGLQSHLHHVYLRFIEPVFLLSCVAALCHLCHTLEVMVGGDQKFTKSSSGKHRLR